MNWRNISVGHEKYVRFSPTCDFSGFLGNKGMGRKVILDDAEQGASTQAIGVPTGSIGEVEEAIAIDENEVGTNSQPPRVKDQVEDVEMTDVGADMEAESSPKRERTASPSPTPRKRRRSGNSKPNSTETDLRTRNGPALTSRRTRSHVEFVVPPRNGDSPTKLKKYASRKPLVPESPVPVKKTSPIKTKASAREPAPATSTDEEGEPIPTKRAPPEKPQKRKPYESESEEEQESSDKPTPGPSKPKPTQRLAQESSPVPDHADGASTRGRRSAARKADEKLKGIMPDVINFQKEMKRGVVVNEWEKAEKEQERMEHTKEKEREKLKESTRGKVKEKGKRRRSDIRYHTSEWVFQLTQN